MRGLILPAILAISLGAGLPLMTQAQTTPPATEAPTPGVAAVAPTATPRTTIVVDDGAQTAAPRLATVWKLLDPASKTDSKAFGALLLAIAIAAFWGSARLGDMLRDGAPQTFIAPGAVVPTVPHAASTQTGTWTGTARALRRPYSLAQSQMCWWFIIILISYLYLFAVTGNLDTLSDQALILMGIGTGTALGAAMVEQNKTNQTLADYQAALAQWQTTPTPALRDTLDDLAAKLASQDFFHDILTDQNGISLHRFQSLVWTVVLGALFLVEVVVRKAMPTFDPNTLAVLGISAGTYLGFKVPEKPN
ncbi:hypothetical protein [Azospirillum sp. B4]|uniref:hypothetical protein n=1 Tax=Azospirillum sp. B4 TaxID=95605 RepID=UPI00034BF5B0|nr:hypothetical protein [Azospirillum sp. B4]